MRFLLFLVASAALAQPSYDLLLKGGHVIDPKNRISARRDVAIAAGKIAAVGENIPASAARKTVDVSGLYVTPGLVDIHVHVFPGPERSYSHGSLSVYPDPNTFRAGVTTVVDAGTSGWRNFDTFKELIIDRARTRVLALLNIVGAGMGGEVEQNTEDMDPKATSEMVRKHRDIIVGIKTAHFTAPNWTAVDRGLEAARLADVPLMVDFGRFTPERPYEDLVSKKLGPGDIYTHTYLASVPMFDDQGRVRKYLFEAQKRGVIFDVGHGGGSFVFRYAVPAMKQGFLPNSISTDLHATSVVGGMKDMTNVMSKFVNMGMPLDDVILRSTWNPAREMKREDLGHLSVGAPADVAVLRVVNGDFGFVDVYGARLRGTKKLVAEVTLRDGRVVWDLNGLTREDWDKLGKYGPQGNSAWDGSISRGVRSRR
ncbi:MAG: amidohydrolase/deacetylase family metallohydrolase [Acidobacteria bacterium]|nr:amidohydrolase/deacetylase family metallohydrolase [Acidobacteriota bacterium]MBI3279822.1 amidohydrolase/deacetylase family metallohydrolase [Acidobacteriota bacterium]